jgi:N-acyl-D-aspartate/D-glutamate deacylase
MFDLLIAGGTAVDGTGRRAVRADVAVSDGRIEAMGRLAGSGAMRVMDASGLVVAPGFVDMHSHSDFTLLVDPRAQSQIFQGVTTEVVGNCGHGCAPVTEPPKFTGNIYGWTPQVEISWRSFDGYLGAVERARPAVNVASLVPNGNLRLAAMDETDRPATRDEAAKMGRLLEEGLDAGAWGFSTGLEYPAERAAGGEELVELCRVTARHGGTYAAHTRNREIRAVDAVHEAVETARAAGVRLQVSHINPRRGGPPDALARCIGAVESAREHGLDAAFDVHTRMYGITNLSNALPAWAFEGGLEALRERLGDASARARLRRHESIISSFALGGWDRVKLYTSPAASALAGLSFAELASRRAPGNGDAWDAVFDVLQMHADDVHAPLCICLSYDESEVMDTMAHPLCTVGSDATALGVDGPLAGQTFMGAFTWAGWYWRKMVTESRRLTIEDAVRRLTSAPAHRLGLKGRGLLAAGAAADLAVLDSKSFRETGTLDQPNRLASGVRHVVVNGVVTIEDGRETGNRGGRVLRME